MAVAHYYMDLNLPVSGRLFAKMVGVASDNAVRKAVERQSIIKGYDAKTKKFFPIIAAAEWGKEILPEYLQAKKPEANKAVKSVATKKQQPDHVAETADEVVAEIMAAPSAKLSKADRAAIDDEPEPEDDENDLGEEGDENESRMSKVEAERRASVLKTKILRLAYMEKRGQMVPITKVNQVLFGYGTEIRNAVEGIPNRCIDKMLGAKNRHDAMKIFQKEIYETLNLLADIAGRELK